MSLATLGYPIAVIGFLAVFYLLGLGRVPRLRWRRRERRPDFGRLGPSLRVSFVQAQAEAVRLNHNYIGTEHLLLGLLGDPSTAVGRMLASRGIELEGSRTRLEAEVGRGTKPVSGEIGLTPRSKRAIMNAIRFVPKDGNGGLAEDVHLLLGLLEVSDGLAVWLLEEGGCDVGELHREAAALA